MAIRFRGKKKHHQLIQDAYNWIRRHDPEHAYYLKNRHDWQIEVVDERSPWDVPGQTVMGDTQVAVNRWTNRPEKFGHGPTKLYLPNIEEFAEMYDFDLTKSVAAVMLHEHHHYDCGEDERECIRHTAKHIAKWPQTNEHRRMFLRTLADLDNINSNGVGWKQSA